MSESLRLSLTKSSAATVAAVVALLLGGCGRSSTADDAGAKLPSIIGKRVEFKQGGDSEQFRVSGWSKTEERFTWTEGTSAKLSLPIGSDTGPWRLKVTMAGLINPPNLSAQPVEVYANDKKVADWQVGTLAEFTGTIPEDANKAGGKLDIEFRVPGATSPKALGINQDPRVLGLCVQSLELDKA